MDSIHGHEVLNMMIESGEQYTHASLEAAIKARFGEQARFHTCSAEGMTAGELVAFLAAKGKLYLQKKVFQPIRVRFAVTDLKRRQKTCRRRALVLCVEGREFFVDKIQTFAAFACKA